MLHVFPHKWIKSTLGHGEAMCKRCLMTNREAWVLGMYCPGPFDAYELWDMSKELGTWTQMRSTN